MSQGYVRVTDDQRHADAVQWWYWWTKEDGWSFARGGRCRSSREARRLIRQAHSEMQLEYKAFQDRPTHELLQDGSLRPFQRSPYEAVLLAP